MKRRNFIRNAGYAGLALGGLHWVACNGDSSTTNKKTTTEKTITTSNPDDLFFKLSLAQWSLNRAIREGGMNPLDFAKKAKELGFAGIEYVNHLYGKSYMEAPNMLEAIKGVGKDLLVRSKDNGIESLIIMIDGAGDLANENETERKKGIENHHKWVDLAKFLGCHSIRVNLHGEGTRQNQIEQGTKSMRELCEYAKPQGINVIVENHGGNSSDPTFVAKVLDDCGMSNAGTLPDFGNFCIRREGDKRWGAPCVEEYPDIYEGIAKMMPYAKGVSAKSYDFDANGDETKIDYYKMMKVVKDAGYTGYVGVEFEGEMDEEKGIIATRDLLVKAGKAV